MQIRNVRLDFFNKPIDTAYTEGSELPYPMATENLNHEIELVVTIGKNGTNLSESEALDYVFGYAVGLDLTRRDLQGEAKKKGRPWTTAKGFDHSAPCSALHLIDDVGHTKQVKITLSVNGEVRQQRELTDMICGLFWKLFLVFQDYLNCIL